MTTDRERTDSTGALQFDVTPVDTRSIRHQLRIDLAAGAQLLFVTATDDSTRWLLVAPCGTTTPIASQDAAALIAAHAAKLMLEGAALGRRVWVEDDEGHVLVSGVVVAQDVDADTVHIRPDKLPASVASQNYRVKARLSDCEFKD
jgi:hypothetical protein